MKTTFGYNFYARKSKATATNQAPLELGITINGKRVFINLPTKVNVDDFNRKRQPQEIKDLVFEWRKKVQESITKILEDGNVLTAETLRDYLRTGGKRSYTVEDLFNEYLAILHNRIGNGFLPSAYRKYELTKELFFKYANKNAELTSITPAFMENFYCELNKIYKVNSSASYMAKIKRFFQFALDNDKIKINPFQSIKIKKEHNEIEYLTEDELETIRTQQYSTEALRRVADVFLIQAYSGLAFVDIEALKKEDIKNDTGVYYIRKKRVKTGVEYTAVLFPQAIPLLEKYNYKLPIISNQKTNSALKAIARECGIDKRVYDHLGRKSYGTMLLNRNVRLEIVAKALGHSQTKTTATYYAHLHDSTVINEIAAIM